MERSKASKTTAATLAVVAVGFVAASCSRDAGNASASAQSSGSALAPAQAAAAATVDGNDPNRCQKCEEERCPVLVADCVSAECKGALACFWKNKCAADEDHLYNCYCGATSKEDCFLGKAPPKGVCMKELQAGARSDVALEVGHRFFDRDFPTGQAIQIAACVLRNCKGCPP